MNYDFTHLKNHINETKDWLEKEFSQISTGRATPSLLDSIKVSSYGSLQPLKSLCTISLEDARTLRLVPWTVDSIKNIENAITDSGLPVSVSTDEKGLRVAVPELTEETRQKYSKLAKSKLEEARVSIRNERKAIEKDIESKEKEGNFAEDEKFRLKDEMQKIIDAGIKALTTQYENKEKSIMSV